MPLIIQIIHRYSAKCVIPEAINVSSTAGTDSTGTNKSRCDKWQRKRGIIRLICVNYLRCLLSMSTHTPEGAVKAQ